MADELAPLPDLIETEGARRPLWLRVVLLIGAGLFFVLGIVGWLVPVVSGVPFYLVAAVLLGMASRRGARVLNRLERKLPRRARLALRRMSVKRREKCG